MRARLWLSLAMFASGAALFCAAGLASAAGSAHRVQAFKKGGIFRVGYPGGSVHVDPQLTYITISWWWEYATAAKLYNYPDKSGPAGAKLVPEVASNFEVSHGGRWYTFAIRNGFRFSDGNKVTAANFKYAINRVANHDLASPAAQFITDPNGTNIVGAQAVNAGEGTNVTGVVVKGKKLTIKLVKPDATFMAKITMPFFQATSTKLPLTREVVNVSGQDLPSAGPYYLSRNNVNQLTSIRRNPFYKKGAGRSRNLEGVDIAWNLNEQTMYLQTLAGELDEDFAVPASEIVGLKRRFGINKTRYWHTPRNCVGYLAMNTSRPLFRNVKLRKALNLAVSRKDYLSQLGPDAGRPWSHLLPPGVPGSRKGQAYPLKQPNLRRAHRLVNASALADKKINVWYIADGTAFPAQSEIVRRDLIRLGFRSDNITMKGFSLNNMYTAMGIRENSADLGINMAWCSDYPDPYDWLNILLDGGNIRAEGNSNYSYLNDEQVNRKLRQVAKLTGQKRLDAYGALDLWIAKNIAPLVVEHTFDRRYLFSSRVQPKSLVYQNAYSDFDITTLALKKP